MCFMRRKEVNRVFKMPDGVMDAFRFLDLILFWIPGWNQIKEVILNSIVIAEVAAKYGAGIVKRETVVNAVFEQIKGVVPVWMYGFAQWAIGLAVDTVVDYLNRTFGKQWIEIILGGGDQS